MFSLLNVRSVDDLTARARIRDAAMLRFGRDGFGVGLRQIAADADVSPALVLHHFGSKDGLRAACDQHVHDVLREVKSDAMDRSAQDVLAQLAATEQYAPFVAYLVRVVLDGGPAAAAFVDDMLDDTVAYLAHGERAGVVRPTSDPRGRARYVVAGQLGMLLMQQLDSAVGRGPSPTTDPAAAIAHVASTTTRAAFELYTHGLFADESYLDAWDAAVAAGTAPVAGADAAPSSAPAHESPDPAPTQEEP